MGFEPDTGRKGREIMRGKPANEKLVNQHPLGMLRMLKGCPLAALFALGLARQPVGRAWVAQVTGYSQNTVQQALEYLAELGLAARSGRYEGWSLAVGAEHLPLLFPVPAAGEESEGQKLTLPGGAAPEGGEDSEHQNLTLPGGGVLEADESERQNMALAGGAAPEAVNSEGHISTLPGGPETNEAGEGQNLIFESQNLTLPDDINTTATTSLMDRESRFKAAAVEAERASIFDAPSKIDTPSKIARPGIDARALAENREALHAAGVRGRVAEELARMEHVTPAYVRAHAEKIRRDGDSVGLLVTRIRDGDPAPPHPKNCLCVDCDRKRRRGYASGDYAEFIQH